MSGEESQGAAPEAERDELKRLRIEVAAYRLEHRLLGRAGGLLLLGQDLRDAIRGWLVAFQEHGGLPVEETATLGAALIRRVIRVGFVGFLLASGIPTAILVWQNLLIRDQNRYLREQTSKLQTQIDREALVTSQARRSEALAVLLHPGCSAGRDDCPHGTVRKEALLTIRELDRHGGRVPNLAGVNMAGLDLTGEDLARTNLRGSRFTTESVQGVDLTAADLTNTHFGGVTFVTATMVDAQLAGADLTGATFQTTDLHNTDLSNTRGSKCTFTDSPMIGARLTGAHLTDCDFEEVDLSTAVLANATFEAVDFAPGVVMAGADLTHSNFRGSWLTGTMPGVQLTASLLEGIDISYAIMTDAVAPGADFTSATLENVDLTGADLRLTRFVDAELTDCDLSRADLSLADFRGATLTRVNVTEDQLRTACFDQAVALPNGSVVLPDPSGCSRLARVPHGWQEEYTSGLPEFIEDLLVVDGKTPVGSK